MFYFTVYQRAINLHAEHLYFAVGVYKRLWSNAESAESAAEAAAQCLIQQHGDVSLSLRYRSRAAW